MGEEEEERRRERREGEGEREEGEVRERKEDEEGGRGREEGEGEGEERDMGTRHSGRGMMKECIAMGMALSDTSRGTLLNSMHHKHTVFSC